MIEKNPGLPGMTSSVCMKAKQGGAKRQHSAEQNLSLN